MGLIKEVETDYTFCHDWNTKAKFGQRCSKKHGTTTGVKSKTEVSVTVTV